MFTTGDGNTPLSPDEQADLIPNLATKEELNEFERAKILVAYDWALAPRNLRRQDPLANYPLCGLNRGNPVRFSPANRRMPEWTDSPQCRSLPSIEVLRLGSQRRRFARANFGKAGSVPLASGGTKVHLLGTDL